MDKSIGNDIVITIIFPPNSSLDAIFPSPQSLQSCIANSIRYAIPISFIINVIYTLGILALFGVWYYFTSEIGQEFVQDNQQYYWLIALIFAVGILITVLSSIFATWRYLKSSVDDLYYS